jgi:hypothetical protein
VREIEGSADDWLQQRSQADVQDEAVAGGEPFPPVEIDTTVTDWRDSLIFDPAGDTVTDDGKERLVVTFAKSGRSWARLAADALEGKTSAANINNRALALVYADPDDLDTPAHLLQTIESNATAAANLAILKDHGAEVEG